MLTKPVTRYGVTLMDCPDVSSADRAQAEERYRAVIETELGGQVQAAYQTYLQAIREHGMPPLPDSAPPAAHRAVTRWQNADDAAINAAFCDWWRHPEGAWFEISF